jgi:hypothetical protein
LCVMLVCSPEVGGLEEVEESGESEMVYAERVSTRVGTTRGEGEGLEDCRAGVMGAGRGGPGGGLLLLVEAR